MIKHTRRDNLNRNNTNTYMIMTKRVNINKTNNIETT